MKIVEKYMVQKYKRSKQQQRPTSGKLPAVEPIVENEHLLSDMCMEWRVIPVHYGAVDRRGSSALTQNLGVNQYLLASYLFSTRLRGRPFCWGWSHARRACTNRPSANQSGPHNCFPPRDHSPGLKSTEAWRQSVTQVANLARLRAG